MAPGPVTVTKEESSLVDRARTLLASGPQHSVPLIEHVCRLPGAPGPVVEQLALALFTGTPDVVRNGDGSWGLVRETHPRPKARMKGVVRRPLDALSFVVVDVETTGGSPLGGDRITEIGAVTVKGGEIVDRWETLLNPERPIPPAVTALTRITWGMVRNKPTIRDVADEVARVIRGHVFVAHNAAFDWRFLSSELARYAGRRLEGERLCTVRLARAVLPSIRRKSLDSLSHYYGIENEARHRAGGDALATARVLLRLLDAARDRGCETLEDVRQLIRGVPSRGRGRKRRRGTPTWSDGEITA